MLMRPTSGLPRERHTYPWQLLCGIREGRIKLDSSPILNAIHKHSNNQIIAVPVAPIYLNELFPLMPGSTLISKGTLTKGEAYGWRFAGLLITDERRLPGA